MKAGLCLGTILLLCSVLIPRSWQGMYFLKNLDSDEVLDSTEQSQGKQNELDEGLHEASKRGFSFIQPKRGFSFAADKLNHFLKVNSGKQPSKRRYSLSEHDLPDKTYVFYGRTHLSDKLAEINNRKGLKVVNSRMINNLRRDDIIKQSLKPNFKTYNDKQDQNENEELQTAEGKRGFSFIKPNFENEGKRGFSFIKPDFSKEEKRGFSFIKPNFENDEKRGFSFIKPNFENEEKRGFSFIKPNFEREEKRRYTLSDRQTNPQDVSKRGFSFMKPDFKDDYKRGFSFIKPNFNEDKRRYTLSDRQTKTEKVSKRGFSFIKPNFENEEKRGFSFIKPSFDEENQRYTISNRLTNPSKVSPLHPEEPLYIEKRPYYDLEYPLDAINL